MRLVQTSTHTHMYTLSLPPSLSFIGYGKYLEDGCAVPGGKEDKVVEDIS